MRNWRLLQLEPSAMRRPDDFENEDSVTATGGHIPAALYRIASTHGTPDQEGRVYSEIANRLAELVDGVRRVWIDSDEKRRVLTLMMGDRYGLQLPASALSDGTMRFIALTVLQQDMRETGVICLEEPENGIHPQRIDAMLQLLNDIAVDTASPVDDENPLRQVLVNTHSPVLAGRVAEDDLLFAQTRSRRVGQRRVPELTLACLDETWRARPGGETIAKGKLLGYLRGAAPEQEEAVATKPRRRRVIDRFHSGQLDLFSAGE
jgi:predicted ATPase